ncbi:STAS domain-containing protein [Yoonia sp.]|uniref:STAS domain-containing protein n=1 Tax=Yoonia sp. TaxID=2212373 RepID=UPI00391D56D8
MKTQPATFVLPRTLTFEACTDLHEFLTSAQGADVVLDGSGVTRLGGIAAQLLACASIIWSAAGHQFSLADPSDSLRKGLTTLALWPLPQQQGGI